MNTKCLPTGSFKIGFIIIVFIIFCLNSYALCQVSVYLDDSANDLVGQRLVYKIRESIRESIGLELAAIEEHSIIQLRILTLDANHDGYSTVYSVVWTLRLDEDSGNIFYTHQVGTCGTSRVNEVAEGIVADTDTVAQNLKELYALFLNEYYDDNYEKEYAGIDVGSKIGFEVANCTRDIAEKYNLDSINGVVVTKIIYDTPAYISDLLEGDVILEIQDKEIYNVDDFEQALSSYINRNTETILLYIRSDNSSYKYIAIDL